MIPSHYVLVLLGCTFALSALWAAVLLVLVRLRERDTTGVASRLGVELVWAVIPAIIVLSIVLPALQSGWSGTVTDGRDDRMADVRTAP